MTTRVGQLPAATSIATTDYIPVEQGGVLKRANPTLLPFVQSGTRPTSGTVAAALWDRSVNVKDSAFGATGDGVTNDYTALLAAVTFAALTGRTIYLPTGTYFIGTTTLVIPSNVSVRGDGITASIIYYTGTGVAVQGGNTAAAADTSTQLKGSLEDFGILGNGVGVGGSIGLALTKCKDGMVKSVQCTSIETAFKVDGSDGFCASNEFYHLRTSNVKNGLLLTGTTSVRGCNNNKFFGGYIFGDGTKPVGGLGVSVVFGDTNQFFGTAWEGFETCGSVTSLSATGHRFIATRHEDCTNGLTLAASTVKNLVLAHSGTVTDNGAPGNSVISDRDIFMDSSGNLTLRGPTGAGKALIYDAANSTGLHAFRVNGSNKVFLTSSVGWQMQTARMQDAQGATVSSANNLALGTDGNRFQISGTTQINLIANSSWQGGAIVTLHFQGIVTVKHNQAASSPNMPIMLAGSVDFVSAANGRLVLQYDSTDTKWYEIGRTVA